MLSPRIQCELCGTSIPRPAHYVVRIDVFANAEMPEISKEELDEMDFDKTWNDLIEAMQKLTPEEAMDQVHRRFEYKICPKCQRQFLINPLGKPRTKHVGGN